MPKRDRKPRFLLTFIGLALAVIVYVITSVTELEVFEHLARLLERHEQYEIDEIVIGVIIVGAFASADLFRQRRAARIAAERERIYHAMLKSTHHLLNNFLNKMTLFKITAEDTPGFDKEQLEFYDKIIDEVQQELEALGAIEDIDVESIEKSLAPKENSA